jgi:hypothetical protein
MKLPRLVNCLSFFFLLHVKNVYVWIVDCDRIGWLSRSWSIRPPDDEEDQQSGSSRPIQRLHLCKFAPIVIKNIFDTQFIGFG